MIANASIMGQQNRSKIYYMDGIVNTSVRSGTYVALPDIDSLQEFKVQSQSDKAEFGGVTGGVVNMTSKSGTNRYRRLRLRLLPQRAAVRPQPVPRRGRRRRPLEHPDFQQGQFGAERRRPDLEGQDVLLRLLRRLALPRLLGHRGSRPRRSGS